MPLSFWEILRCVSALRAHTKKPCDIDIFKLCIIQLHVLLLLFLTPFVIPCKMSVQ